MMKEINDSISEMVSIPYLNGTLEGLLSYPSDSYQTDGVLLLPPHPNFAGTMSNNVVKALSETLSVSGFSVLCFNYPGIGNSSIEIFNDQSTFDYWNDVEQKQRFGEAVSPAKSALDYLRKSLSTKLGGVHLVGYSFGGIIALILAQQEKNIESLTAIAMPWIPKYSFNFLKKTAVPKYFITGKDDFTFHQDVFDRVWPSISNPKKFISVENDHFFRNSERDLAENILSIIA